MPNNLDAPNIKYVKWMKWTLNRINYYYKTLYINLHYLSTDTSISQSSIIIIWYYDNLALYDDRTLVIRITKYEFIFVMLTELRTGAGA